MEQFALAKWFTWAKVYIDDMHCMDIGAHVQVTVWGHCVVGEDVTDPSRFIDSFVLFSTENGFYIATHVQNIDERPCNNKISLLPRPMERR